MASERPRRSSPQANGANADATRSPPLLVWQYDNSARWEGDWIRELVAGVCASEIHDERRYRTISPSMYVVENELTEQFYQYCRNAHDQGCKITLIHLGDEGFFHDLGVYSYCSSIWRNHWSASVRDLPSVSFLPLGYKSGFARETAPPPPGARAYRWGFAGDPNKSTRGDMLASMRTIVGGREHLTAGWGTPDSLPVAEYRAFMESVVFAPCPRGFLSPDCFRLYEALEAGCIPIIERGGNGLEDYFTTAFGAHPLPSIDNWGEAPALVSAIVCQNKTVKLQSACMSWWNAYKQGLKLKISIGSR